MEYLFKRKKKLCFEIISKAEMSSYPSSFFSLLPSLISSHLVINVTWKSSAVFIFSLLYLMWTKVSVYEFLTTPMPSWSKFHKYWILI